MNPRLGIHQKWTILLLLATLVGCIRGQTGYRCYTCVSQDNDMICLNNPNQVIVGSPSTQCDQEDGSGNFGWCTIRRVEYTDMPGTVVSFMRGCSKTEPPIQDDILVDNQFTTFYRTCRSHLCNIGDGVDSLDTSNDVAIGAGGSNRKPIIVPAEDAALPNSPSILILVLLLGLLSLVIHFP